VPLGATHISGWLPLGRARLRHVLPGFREVLDCASPLALWLPLQKWVHGTDARPILEVEASMNRAAVTQKPWSPHKLEKGAGRPGLKEDRTR
jgi:hypothetical protein